MKLRKLKTPEEVVAWKNGKELFEEIQPEEAVILCDDLWKIELYDEETEQGIKTNLLIELEDERVFVTEW